MIGDVEASAAEDDRRRGEDAADGTMPVRAEWHRLVSHVLSALETNAAGRTFEGIEGHGHTAMAVSNHVPGTGDYNSLESAWHVRIGYLLTTWIVFGLAASVFGMVSVSRPFSYFASALSASTGMLMLRVRWNLPWVRSCST